MDYLSSSVGGIIPKAQKEGLRNTTPLTCSVSLQEDELKPMMRGAKNLAETDQEAMSSKTGTFRILQPLGGIILYTLEGRKVKADGVRVLS